LNIRNQDVIIDRTNLDQIEDLLEELSIDSSFEIKGIYCPDCEQKTNFHLGSVPCEDCGDHCAVACDNCYHSFDSVWSRYEEIEEYNKKRFSETT